MGAVGVSRGGAEREHTPDAAAPAQMLAGLPPDFRGAWNKMGSRVVSEHERFTADVYETNHVRYIEELFEGDAGAGLYLMEPGDAGQRFAVADVTGHLVADSALDGGPSLEACARCHATARGFFFPVVP
jgi:hypothetical protein